MPLPDTEANPPPVPRRRRLWGCGCLLALVLSPVLALVGYDAAYTEYSNDLVTPGQGWVAFRHRVDYALLADSDTSLVLARALDDRGTWHRLGPMDSQLQSCTFEWVTPTWLRIRGCTLSERWVTQVEDVHIEWLP